MSVNKVILVGRLGNDPEVRYTANGLAIATVSLATNEVKKDKQTGQKQEHTEWHRVIFFEKLAEIVGEYLRKGSQVYVEGRLQTNKWQDKNGQDRYTTEIIASEMKMLGSRGDSANVGPPPTSDQRNAPPSIPSAQTTRPTTATTPPTVAPSNAPLGNFDDDVPF